MKNDDNEIKVRRYNSLLSEIYNILSIRKCTYDATFAKNQLQEIYRPFS